MLRGETWQGDYRPAFNRLPPSPLKAMEITLKRLERFQRLERTDPGGFVLQRLAQVLSR